MILAAWTSALSFESSVTATMRLRMCLNACASLIRYLSCTSLSMLKHREGPQASDSLTEVEIHILAAMVAGDLRDVRESHWVRQ